MEIFLQRAIPISNLCTDKHGTIGDASNSGPIFLVHWGRCYFKQTAYSASHIQWTWSILRLPKVGMAKYALGISVDPVHCTMTLPTSVGDSRNGPLGDSESPAIFRSCVEVLARCHGYEANGFWTCNQWAWSTLTPQADFIWISFRDATSIIQSDTLW